MNNFNTKFWEWKGLRMAYIQQDSLDDSDTAIVLIHGFGACKEHWRYNIKPLSTHANVYAVDLIGFGESDKPYSHLKDETPSQKSFCYCIDNWAEQVVDFIETNVCNKSIVITGNSIGGVVACQSAKLLEKKDQKAQQLILIDCAQRQIDDKRLSEQPLFRRLSKPLLKTLVRQRWITKLIYRALAKKSIIKKVLEIAYPTKQHVNSEIIDILYSATQSKNADESFRGFINLFDDRLAPDILKTLTTPVHLIWGEKDPWEPVEQAERWVSINCVESINILQKLGHCPHDEGPEIVNTSILKLIQS
ncbi:alpha/beta fold hydrolase [bacterium]|nr:alpha/beta fold hydrolase [bacterium]